MATVWLDRYECTRDERLPPVCMVCGADATTTRKVTFRWCPPWVIVLILAGLLIWAIVSIILTKRMVVYAPVCDEHAGYWRRRLLIGWALVLAGLAAFAGGVAVSVGLTNDPQYKDVAPWGFVGGGVALLVLLIAGAIAMRAGIRPTEITGEEVRLTGVDGEFVEALRDQRREEREREKARRRARRRDDYDRDDE